MALYKPWRYIPREVNEALKTKKLKSAFDEARQTTTNVAGPIDRILSETDAKLDRILRPRTAMSVLGASQKYVGAPIGGIASGRLGAEQKQLTDGNGNMVTYRAGSPSWSDFGRGLKKAVTQDPAKTYIESRQAFEEGQLDPELPTWKRVAASAAYDPLNYVPAGSGASALRRLPAGIQASRGARAAAKVANVVETPRRVAAGAIVGSAAGAELADKAGAPEWVGSLAGGLGGGGLAAMRRPKMRAPAMVDYQHPKADAYLETLDRHSIPYEFDADGVIRPDAERLRVVRDDLASTALHSQEPRGVFAPQTSEWVEVGGKQVRRKAKRLDTVPGEVDVDAAADLERLDELLADSVPDASIEEGRRARIQSLDEERIAAEFPPPPPKSERALKMAATRARKAEEAAAAKVANANAPRMLRDGAKTIVKKADGTSESFFTPKGPRGEKGRLAANALYEAEDAKWQAKETFKPEPGIKEKPVSLKSETTEQGFKAMAARQERAGEKFIETVMENHGLAREDALAVLGYYQRKKLVRLDPVDGQFYLKHGGLLDKEVIDDAAVLAREANHSRSAAADQSPATGKMVERDMFGNEVVPPPVKTSQPKLELEGGSRGLKVPSNQSDFLAGQDRADLPQRVPPSQGDQGAQLDHVEQVPPPGSGGSVKASTLEDGARPEGDLLPALRQVFTADRESRYLGTNIGKFDQAVRRQIYGLMAKLGPNAAQKASNMVRDPRYTPVWQGMSYANNVRQHIKARSEDLWKRVEASGYAVERNADGQWVHTESGLPTGDIVEQATPEAAAAWEALPENQKAALSDLVKLADTATGTQITHGADPRLLVDEDTGQPMRYFPRMVEAVGGQSKSQNAFHRGRAVGTTRGPDRARTVDSMTEGAERTKTMEEVDPDTGEVSATEVDNSVQYAHPLVAFQYGIDQKLMNATDTWAAKRLVPLGVLAGSKAATEQGAREGFGFSRVHGHPAFEKKGAGPQAIAERIAGEDITPEAAAETIGAMSADRPYLFRDEDAARIQAGLEGPTRGTLGTMVTGINEKLTPIRASLDFSATFQQGLRMWLDDPKSAAKLWKKTFQSLKDDDVYYQTRQALDANGPGTEYAVAHGLRQTAEGEAHEFALPRIGGENRFGKAYNKVAEKSQQHFDRLLNLYRLQAFNREHELLSRTLEGDALDTEMFKVSRAINRSYGWSETRPTTIESMALFAPRYFRASTENVFKALSRDGIESSMARKHLGLMALEGAALVFAVNELRGYPTEIDPRESNFLRIRNVGGVDVSPFGTYDVLFRAIVGTATGDVTRPFEFARGKASPVLGQGLTQIQGKTYFGEPLDGPDDRAWEIVKTLAPFGIQNILEEGVENGSLKDAGISGGVGFLGISNRPSTPAERRDFAREGHNGVLGFNGDGGVSGEKFGRPYDDLAAAEKSQVNEDPRVAKWQGEVDRRASKGEGDRAAQARIREMVKSETDASAAFLAAGKDSSGKAYSGNDFRKAYNDTMVKAAGAREILAGKNSGALAGWFNLYEQAKLANGQTDYDVLERLQGEYRTKNPNIDAELEKAVGVRDNAAVRELREARKLAAAYYAIPRFKGMTVEESEQAGEVLRIASDMVKFGQARNRGHAFVLLRGVDPDGVALARKAARKGSNPERAAFRKENALFAKYYSDAPVVV